ncbi:lipocalin-like domain-containing protein [Segetibacter sp.]|jgi:hypothetical protein|uniref:lipocalin-like domain-containing protein n=1 Tax=Segetibacter sp. TaxID=2231182 RepID=UPI00263227F2|nr:lipocalin-like domain-containing protein [Segetibacter sp.]MCW3081698.1 hypothetical protein [Segetibacter sp.]
MLTKQQDLAAICAITLPKDQYAHEGAQNEWWWHVGTLKSSDGRKFGFEINAAGKSSYAFTQIEITDVQNQCNYQKVNPIIARPSNWAQYNIAEPWYVQLSGPAANLTNGAILMQSIDGNPLNMGVKASFIDVASNVSCQLNLSLYQQGSPLLVWGTGCKLVNSGGTSPLTKNNYYYSLTHLRATGSITIGDEVVHVTGLTWMDHEYGAFPDNSTWTLQDIQLSNGMHLSNFTNVGDVPKENIPMISNATILFQNGKSIYVKTVTTPMEPIFTSNKEITYYLKFKVEINSSELTATFIVNSLYPDQLFKDEAGPDVYEGVAECHARFGSSDEIVFGTAWIEQNLG